MSQSEAAWDELYALANERLDQIIALREALKAIRDGRWNRGQRGRGLTVHEFARSVLRDAS